MQIEIIKKVKFTCSDCDSAIILNVPAESGPELQEILNVSESLKCPKCKEPFSCARNTIEAIAAYNHSTIIMNRYRSLFKVEFE